jgi:hypothetical protein
MDNQEAIEMLTAKAECIRREASGTDIDCKLRNCDECELCYAQGTTGEQRKALNMAISALRAQDLQPTCNNLATNTIDKQAAIDIAKDLLIQMEEYHQYNQAVNNYCAELVKLPPVQPEIIRCKDCIHRKKDEIFGDQWCHGRKINDDWYCADAERREE